jgi:hypothetical protein
MSIRISASTDSDRIINKAITDGKLVKTMAPLMELSGINTKAEGFSQEHKPRDSAEEIPKAEEPAKPGILGGRPKGYKFGDKPRKPRQIGIRCSDEQYQKWSAQAKAEGLTLTQYVCNRLG